MQHDECLAVFTFAQSLWPEWKPYPADVESWTRLLSHIASPDAARTALRAHKDATDWVSPKRSQFLAMLPRAASQGSADPAASRAGFCGIWIQCVAHEAKASMIGDFKTLWWSSNEAIPEHNRLMTIMETFRADHERLYGGHWQIIREFNGAVSETQMCQRRAELRGTVPFDQRTKEPPPAEYRGTPRYLEPGDREPKPIRQALQDFMAGRRPRHQPPPDSPGPEPISPDLGDEPF